MNYPNYNNPKSIGINYFPHNLLAEKIVLNNLIYNPDARESILTNLSTDAFYFKNHQQIYKTILTLQKKNNKLDFLILQEFILANGLLDDIGGITILNQLSKPIPNITNLDEYIQLIQDKFLRRMLIKLGYQIINSAYITNLSLEKILQDLEVKIFDLTNNNQRSNIQTSAELFHQIFGELKLKSELETNLGLKSGFNDLDFMTQGFQKSDLVIIAGRPSMGKTAFALEVALHVVKSTHLPTIFFSLEMSKEQVIYRLLGHETYISKHYLQTGNLTKQNWDQIITCIKQFSYLPFYIDDTPNLSILDIRSKLRKILFDHDQIGLVIVDYLQLMGSSSKQTENRVQQLSEITRALKSIAREFKIPVLALSQLSRSLETRINKRPILSDLRESGSIEQDADLVLMLYRDDYYNLLDNPNNIAEVIIAKHRNGPIGTISLNFDSQFTRFTNLIV
jgi:replicative DNA helicase